MKKVIILAVLAITTTAGYAQTKAVSPAPAPATSRPNRADKSPQELAHQRVEKLSKELNLSPEQKGKLMPVFTEAIMKRREVKNSDVKKKGEMKSVHDNVEEAMKSVLTAEQYAKWQTIKDEKKEDIKKRREEHDNK